MDTKEDFEFKYSFENWVQCIESHQRCMSQETERFVEVLKQRELSNKIKDEIASTIGDLIATIDTISEMIKKYVE